jgi:lipopolysaccharide export system permease protein
MKKLLFQKFLKDTLKFFIIVCFSIGLIVWVVQAVNYLDFVTEDGHGLYVYFSYSILSFPKIIHRILPFVFFISLFYQIAQYELKNELLIFWTNGISKMQFINVVIIYSILITLFQIFLGAFISPASQNEARSFIRNSNIDFFPSLIKEGKFIDTVSDLTIFIESKDKIGNYKNIFLNESYGKNKKINQSKSQMIYAKKGILVNEGKNRYFELTDGKMINKDNGKITNFAFKKINFNLNKFDSKSTSFPKIQELTSNLLIQCMYYDYKNEKNKLVSRLLNCDDASIKNIKQEVFKRFYKPIYFPLLALISCLLIFKSKESVKYNYYRIYLFLTIFSVLVVSEISLRYASYNMLGMYFFILFPIFIFFTIYISLIIKIKNKI